MLEAKCYHTCSLILEEIVLVGVMSCDMISSNPDSLSVKYSLIFYSVSLFIQLAYMELHSLRSRLPDLTYLTQQVGPHPFRSVDLAKAWGTPQP